MAFLIFGMHVKFYRLGSGATFVSRAVAIPRFLMIAAAAKAATTVPINKMLSGRGTAGGGVTSGGVPPQSTTHTG